jgi:hypothetical protein
MDAFYRSMQMAILLACWAQTQSAFAQPFPGKQTAESVATAERARSSRIKAAMSTLRNGPPVALDGSDTLPFEQAIRILREERSVESIPLLVEHSGYRSAHVLSLPVGTLDAFPAAGALAELGAPAVPALMEKAKTFTCIAVGYKPSLPRDELIETRTLILHALYAAAGDQVVVDEGLEAELARLEARDPRTVEIERQKQNLMRVLEEAQRMREEARAERRLIDERKRKVRKKGVEENNPGSLDAPEAD